MKKCINCKGKGYKDNYDPFDWMTGKKVEEKRTICPACAGTGKWARK